MFRAKNYLSHVETGVTDQNVLYDRRYNHKHAKINFRSQINFRFQSEIGVSVREARLLRDIHILICFTRHNYMKYGGV